jgi:predicted metal-dependent phosphoesterase TrpH
MPEKYDLHCHSTASDGSLTPTELVQRAKNNGVTNLSLTDHDTTAGIIEAQTTADKIGIKLIPGVELSANWENKTLHIIGLNIKPDAPKLSQGIENLQATRTERAEKISMKLAKKNIDGALEAVKTLAGKGMITRLHFANFLVANHHVPTQQKAFDKFLGKGKPAFVTTQWPELEKTVSWILESGGIPIIAHPLRYKLSANWMKRLLLAFKDMGGEAIEVVTGRSNAEEIYVSGKYAKKFGLAGSIGSDFHSPDNVWVELGRLAELPSDINPVWNLLN